ncbi:hypothetical protein ACIGW3_12435 [Streptomyces sp. NPDC053499]|uniref:hypothetical protein n=1 Tax=Streptomyces sp. NPDC053499 TaxID=3365707 RepID=UPI0037D1C2E5
MRALIELRRHNERYDRADEVAEFCGLADKPVEHTHLGLFLFGFRAEAGGKNGWAVLKVLCRDAPVVVHVLFTHLAVLTLVVAISAAAIAS